MAVTVSCVIPCYNDGKNLPRAVASVLSQGNDVEAIIVDDCSTDDSFAVATQLAAASSGRVRAYRNGQNGGPAQSRNHGAFYAQGAFLCFLDSDDEYLPGFMPQTVSLLAHKPELAAVKVLIEIVNPDGSSPLKTEDPRFMAACNSYPCNLMMRREVFSVLWGFPTDDRFRGPLGGEDIAFFQAITTLFRCAQVPTPLVRHYNRPGSHLELFLSRSRVEDGRIVFVDSNPAYQEQAVTAATQAYFDRARIGVQALYQCVNVQPVQSNVNG
jgi:glycosyltransferase involved in cell wall biosynthesis